MSTPFYTDASAPFDSSAPKADIILRSSDNVDFYFFKSLLVYSSSFFENLFSDGVPDETSGTDTRPVIALQDHSTDLRLMLTFLHCSTHKIDPLQHLEEAVSLHGILDKYCFNDLDAIIYEIVLASPLVIDATPPIILYAAAVHMQHAPLARLAAKRALRIPAPDIVPLVLGNPAHERALGAYAFHARHLAPLARYHRACAAATALFGVHSGAHKYYRTSWISQKLFAHFGSATCDTSEERVLAQYTLPGSLTYIDLALARFLDAVDRALEIRPCADTVRDMRGKIDDMGKSLLSSSKSKVTFTQITELIQEVCEEVDRRIASVELDISF